MRITVALLLAGLWIPSTVSADAPRAYVLVSVGGGGRPARQLEVRDALVATLEACEGIDVAPLGEAATSADAAASRLGAIVIELEWSLRRRGFVALLRARDPAGRWRSEDGIPHRPAGESVADVAHAILDEVLPAIAGLRQAYRRDAGERWRDATPLEEEDRGMLGPRLWRGGIYVYPGEPTAR